MAMLQRRFASSMYAVRRSLERMRDKRRKILEDPEGYRREQIERRLPDDFEDLPEDEQTVLGHLRRRARAHGVADGRGGAVAMVQRFGAALNLNVHTHALVPDGVFAEEGSDSVRFHPVAPPSEYEMDDLLATVEHRLRRLPARRGVVDNTEGESGPDPWVEEAPVLAGIAAASVQGRAALGPRAGAEVRRCGASAEFAALSASAPGPCHAHRNGFDLHAAVVVPANDRARLERTCRYALRPPVAHDRIHLTNTGQVLLELRHRWSDGTTHVLFDPIEFLERLAALIPRPANQP